MQSTDEKDPLRFIHRTWSPSLTEFLSKNVASKDRATLLISFAGEILYYDSKSGLLSSSIHEYNAIGSGGDFALGSLHVTQGIPSLSPKERVQIALEVSAAKNPNVCGPFDIRGPF
jgi:ATP-dependent protease HslVU (ClpYQ) peptidase subunit